MKRVKIIGFSAAERCGKAGQTSVVRQAFLDEGLTFPIFGMANESQDDLFIDGDKYPWSLSAFIYEEATPTPGNPS